eukprot:TRINITY_DN6961_c0_g1_i1.p1 TRINITY_DN6961_c0_g1~~TRINITY_DN6961_c0_g1_i1.p1  ORF type:complete len:281 (-),score=38.00 TRINITY_DN6961_c0_g1_i1:310-1152(-)
MGLVISPAAVTDVSSYLHPSKVVERPKVIYNRNTKKYVMWMHVDNSAYSLACVGVAVSISPHGPFQLLRVFRPHGCESRDMTIFLDDDGSAYVIYASFMNTVLHIGQLSTDYLNTQGPYVSAMFMQKREAPAVFKYKQVYFMFTSGTTGWVPNTANIHYAVSMMGYWKTLPGSPCVGRPQDYPQKTFNSQGTYVLPSPNRAATGWFLLMADRWVQTSLTSSTYVWLPLKVDLDPKWVQFMLKLRTVRVDDSTIKTLRLKNPVVRVKWHPQWRLRQAVRGP